MYPVSPSEQVPLSWAAGGGTLHLLQLIIAVGGVITELFVLWEFASRRVSCATVTSFCVQG